MIQGLTNIIFSSLPEVLCICQSWCYWFKSWPIICLHQPTLWPKIKTELETQKTKNQNPKKNFKSIPRICILHRPRGRWALLILINLQNEIRGTQLEQKGMKAHFPSFVLCNPDDPKVRVSNQSRQSDGSHAPENIKLYKPKLQCDYTVKLPENFSGTTT